MEWTTKVDIPTLPFCIEPHSRLLCVGSCFADAIGRQLRSNMFATIINPYGVMYNPASILHTISRCEEVADVCIITLGTNHIYRLKETGEIVDNCQKRPHTLFQEEQMDVGTCRQWLQQAVLLLKQRNPLVNIILTVSPIRYSKYGYHGSRLSKATLLLAADQLVQQEACCHYFPAYEIMNDELRDYRFYAEDMLHPSAQAVDYIWKALITCCFSEQSLQYLNDWRPIKEALSHKPFHPESAEYKAFIDKTLLKLDALSKKYPTFAAVYAAQKEAVFQP